MADEVKEKTFGEPTIVEVALNMDHYELKIEEFIIIPRMLFYKDGKLVKVVDELEIKKMAGTINPEYASAFINDMTVTFKDGFQKQILKRMKQGGGNNAPEQRA